MSQDRKSTQISCTCLPWNSLMIYDNSSGNSELSSVKFREKKDTSAHALLTISNERSYNCFSILFRHSEWWPYQFSLMDFISTLFGPKLIRMISRVFGIIWQIRILFSSLRELFLKRFNFWRIQSSITCNETAHVLWAVCIRTIPFRILLCPWRLIITHIEIYTNIFH